MSELLTVRATMLEAYQLLHEGQIALARAERQGIRIDVEYCKEKTEELTKQIEATEAEFKETKLYRRWKHIYGSSANMYSPQQLSRLLYKHMKLAPVKTTPTGEGSTDDDSLRRLGIPELSLLTKARRLRKIRDTYLASFVREVNEDGYLRPSFHLHTARTYRSSSSDPNFQNIPKRDKEAMDICRRAMLPRPGHMLVEADFAALEVVVSCFYHKDPEMLSYVKDESKDMHGDMAREIFFLPKIDVRKPEDKLLRNAAKNGFVFPQFYGDYYKNNAYTICDWVELPQDGRWNDSQGVKLSDGTPLSSHLAKHGIRSFSDLVEHLRRVENRFWKERFKVYDRWRDEWVEQYRKTGKLRMLTGFVCSGLMERNEIINYPIQGTAFHCLLKTFILLDKAMVSEGWDTRLVGQIHDSIVMDVNPDELDHVLDTLRRIVEEELPRQWNWIIAPLKIEVETFGVDKPWLK